MVALNISAKINGNEKIYCGLNFEKIFGLLTFFNIILKGL